jgi:hypothetical protein
LVKTLCLLFFLSFLPLCAETFTLESDHYEESVEQKDLLQEKIKALIGQNSYARHIKFIKIIFSNEENYYINDRVDVAKVIQTLKDNGLLDLFFKKPQEMHLTFQSSGYPLFFVKIMSDTLQSMGYYRFITDRVKQDESGFFWTIRLTSEYAIDPFYSKTLCKNAGVISLISIEILR